MSAGPPQQQSRLRIAIGPRRRILRFSGPLDVSDATLSRHVKTLVASGYVVSHNATSPDRGDARRIMWLSLSPTGRRAFDAHICALQDIAGTARF